MKKKFFLTTMVMLAVYILSACGGAPQPVEQSSGDQAAVKVRAVKVAFNGVVEAMNGNEWTINGQTLPVGPVVVRDGPFQVGDTIKVEGMVNSDGSLSITHVEAPSAGDLAELPQLGDDHSNSYDANSNDEISNSKDSNSNVGYSPCSNFRLLF